MNTMTKGGEEGDEGDEGLHLCVVQPTVTPRDKIEETLYRMVEFYNGYT